MNKYFLNLLLLICFSATGFGQTKVVLVNGDAKLVELSGSDVTTIKKDLPRHMRGYEKPSYDLFKKRSPLAELSSPVAVNELGGDIVPSSKSESISNAIYFDSNSAILTDQAIAALKRWSTELKSKGNQTVLLKSFYKEGNTKSQQLVANRLDACKRYLELNGVQSSLIFTTFTGADNLVDYITVNLQ